jgi:glucose-1-phosphate adenylyltransferase
MGVLDKTLTILLAGGVGSRLHPLTADRAKPAVPFGGKYRIIDFTLSNCLHSGLRRILIFTQYKSHSLQKHLRDGWSIFNSECGEFITLVPPQMRTGESWYSGTADAIYQNLYLLERNRADHVLILSADHVYRMDYAALSEYHSETRADFSIACMNVPLAQATSFGVVAADETHRILDFQEKPTHPRPLPDAPDFALASMGIYIFSKEVLCDELRSDHKRVESSHDFARDIIPRLLRTHRVYAYPFGGERGRVTPDHYWRDVGTIDAYYQANMDLLQPVPPMNLYQDDWRIRTYQNQNPPARMVQGQSGNEGRLVNSIISGGVIIAGGDVRHSILFSRVRVQDGARVEDALLFDGVEVGPGAILRRCIIDKDVVVPPGQQIGVDRDADRRRFTVSENGVVVVPKGYCFVKE